MELDKKDLEVIGHVLQKIIALEGEEPALPYRSVWNKVRALAMDGPAGGPAMLSNGVRYDYDDSADILRP